MVTRSPAIASSTRMPDGAVDCDTTCTVAPEDRPKRMRRRPAARGHADPLDERVIGVHDCHGISGEAGE